MKVSIEVEEYELRRIIAERLGTTLEGTHIRDVHFQFKLKHGNAWRTAPYLRVLMEREVVA